MKAGAPGPLPQGRTLTEGRLCGGSLQETVSGPRAQILQQDNQLLCKTNRPPDNGLLIHRVEGKGEDQLPVRTFGGTSWQNCGPLNLPYALLLVVVVFLVCLFVCFSNADSRVKDSPRISESLEGQFKQHGRLRGDIEVL